MFDSRTTKNPKLVYSHSRHGSSVGRRKGEEQTSAAFPQPHAIPRPSVTVVAQTRKPSVTEDNSEAAPRSSAVTPSAAESSIVNAISRFSVAGGATLGEQNFGGHHAHQKQLGRAEFGDNFHGQTVTLRPAVNGAGKRSDSDNLASKHGSNGSDITKIETTSNVDRNNNADSSSIGSSISGNNNSIISSDVVGKYVVSGAATSTDNTIHNDVTNNVFHEGYRVYRGKVYDMVREVPIIITSKNSNEENVREVPIILTSKNSSNDSRVREVPIILAPKSNNDSISRPSPAPPGPSAVPNGKTTHHSTATASIVKVAAEHDDQHTGSGASFSQHQPRALPPPKLNGKTPNGAPWSRAQVDLGSESDYDPAYHHGAYREHRRQSDETRFISAPDFVTYIGGSQGARRAVTATGRRTSREISPRLPRGRAPSPTPAFTRRISSPQRSASLTRTQVLGGHGWAVVAPKGEWVRTAPTRQRSSSTTQQVVTRASYRLDPNIRSKLHPAPLPPNAPPKSILKSPATPSPRVDSHDVLDDDATSSRSHTLPRPRAPLVYRDFDFSGLPQQQHDKRGLQQQPTALPSHHKGKVTNHGYPSPTSGRRPATAGAALHKGSDSASSAQPQKKCVTFSSEVRLHVDNNISTIRSLSVDS